MRRSWLLVRGQLETAFFEVGYRHADGALVREGAAKAEDRVVGCRAHARRVDFPSPGLDGSMGICSPYDTAPVVVVSL